jgi:hypothetical protein
MIDEHQLRAAPASVSLGIYSAAGDRRLGDAYSGLFEGIDARTDPI